MSRKILIVDDAAIIRAMIRDTVTAAGWTVVGEADNGQAGIEKYRELRPHAMTLDLVMPQYDGLHAMRGIREFDPQARIVVVSALDQTEILREAFKAGASDFLVKPFDKQILLDTLDRLVPEEEVVAS
ncbi:MAG: response regulator [Planctomycetota bacterium]|nr:MAG: response regulator [Planctomycetota bacterium]